MPLGLDVHDGKDPSEPGGPSPFARGTVVLMKTVPQ